MSDNVTTVEQAIESLCDLLFPHRGQKLVDPLGRPRIRNRAFQPVAG